MIRDRNGSGYILGLLAISIAAVVLLSACSNNSSSSSSATPAGTSEGIAYDGYLFRALMCIDRDLDKVCDAAEPRDTTSSGGVFRMSDLTDAELQLPLVMEATTQTVDEDDGNTIGPVLKYTAPAGSQAVSAFSTIIQSRIEAALAAGSLASLDDLKEQFSDQLSQELGAGNIDLTDYDPIATKTSALASDAFRELAAELHLVNKVLTEHLIVLKPQAESLAPGDLRAAFGAVVDKLDPAAVRAAVNRDTRGLALEEKISATKNQIVTDVIPPVPTLSEIQAQAVEDEAAESAIREQVNPDATGGTGTGGGTGTS